MIALAPTSSNAPRRAAFTLIELLVVIAIIALLIGIVLPSLGTARRSARSAACLATLSGIGQALTLYANDNNECTVASYTMEGTSGVGVELEGWGPILARDGYVAGAGTQQLRGSAFTCPEAIDVAGLAAGQTGTNPDNPKGWMDWPCVRTGSGFAPTTIPERGFEQTLRVAYWINGDNPIGAVTTVVPDSFYTGSVGYGPASGGNFIMHTRLSAFIRPHTLVAVADGVYAGRQRNNRQGSPNSRIGFRHIGGGGGTGTANVVFADGHAAGIRGDVFPRAAGGDNPLEEVRRENANGQATVYANPERSLGL
ncbi:MAG: prepilin-type N-terminal cleavage/methylation domain-containing protein [Planctomycetota bacterium]|nr:prepilin-type N-terminal cleavage/methylation domain-containing protein [Planctomycetota bacterium]